MITGGSQTCSFPLEAPSSLRRRPQSLEINVNKLEVFLNSDGTATLRDHLAFVCGCWGWWGVFNSISEVIGLPELSVRREIINAVKAQDGPT